MTKVLITGADGFIGSHLTEALVESGFDVRAFVYYNSFNSYGWLDSISNEIKNRGVKQVKSNRVAWGGPKEGIFYKH